MRTLTKTVWLLFFLIFGCGNASDKTIASGTVTLNIFHSNDVMGYIRPCG